MANEDKILAILEDIQKKMNVMQTDIDLIKQNNHIETKRKRPTAKEQIALIEAMRNLLTQEEKDALGRYQEAEEARKKALYG